VFNNDGAGLLKFLRKPHSPIYVKDIIERELLSSKLAKFAEGEGWKEAIESGFLMGILPIAKILNSLKGKLVDERESLFFKLG
jgi:hypothetical protein